jgi:hypothetical protein
MEAGRVRLIPKGWRDFQHYTNRNPPWIRLHRKLLDDSDFHRLPLASRALAPMLWLLASESLDGSIDGDVAELAFRLRQTEKEIDAALKPLISKGFFVVQQDASSVLADCSEKAPRDRGDTETDTETEEIAPTVLVASAAPKLPACPTDELIALYHEHLPTLPRVEILNDTRRKHLSARWREVIADKEIAASPDPKAEALAWFAWFFKHANRSAFLTGKSGDWRAGFDFLIAPKSFAKVIEGNYHKAAA